MKPDVAERLADAHATQEVAGMFSWPDGLDWATVAVTPGPDDGWVLIEFRLKDGTVFGPELDAESAAKCAQHLIAAVVASRPLKDFDPDA